MEDKEPVFSLSITAETKSHLHDVTRWARILSIAGIVIIGLVLVMTLVDLALLDKSFGMVLIVNGSASTEVTPTMRMMTAVSAILFTALLFFPFYFLLKFSGRMKAALAANEQKDLNEAFENLKKYFRYLGIVMLIVIALILLAFLFASMNNVV